MAAKITQLPTPPTPADTPADFNTKAFALLGGMPQFVTEANALSDEVGANAEAADADAIAAENARADAVIAKNTAVAAKDDAEAARDVASGHASTATAQAGIATDKAAEAAAIAVEVAIGAAGGFLFEQNMWSGPRAHIPLGFIPEDGQQVNDATYPEAVAAIRSGKQYAITEAAWQADPLKRNCWSLGDGSTWVRAPDNNGVQAGSLGKMYKAGDAGTLGGTAVSDAIRNITGSGQVIGFGGTAGTNGVVNIGGQNLNLSFPDGGTSMGSTVMSIDASRQVPTASENRPKTSYQCFIVRVSTGVSTNGTTDLEALAQDVAGAIAEINPLKARQKALGDGQTWQDVTSQRVVGVEYLNSTGRVIEVNVSGTSAASGSAIIIISGARTSRAETAIPAVLVGTSMLVAPGATYRYSSGSISGLTVWEYKNA